jgi:TRAP-type C4-dicarboxylate transport system permease small subunit
MKFVSGVLRLICGLALIIFAFATYQRAGAHVAAGQPIEIAGVTIGASASQLYFALVIVAVIGVFLMILGVVTFVKKKP